MKIPRFLHAIYAFIMGYYWLPCNICGRKYGGHEEGGYLMTGEGMGVSVCFNCRDEADRRNQEILDLNNPGLNNQMYWKGN